MTKISIVAASGDRLAAIRDVLPRDIAADYLRLQDLEYEYPRETAILDVDLGRSDDVQAVKAWLAKRSSFGKIIVCIDSGASYLHLTQARALGATSFLFSPPHPARLRNILMGSKSGVAGRIEPASDDPAPELHAVGEMFAGARNGERLNFERTAHAAARIVDRLKTIGLADYLSSIRHHHTQTYQHCLTVTAVATAFGLQLGFGRADTERLAVAGLLHDIGKAKIPFEILEKPAALSDAEAALMREHPEHGHQMLLGTPGLPHDTLDMVLHHHEYLDGSGYPHGLLGSQISDLNRMMTIADIYGALIERRSYKPCLTGRQALQTLRDMGSKLDTALVRAFAQLSSSLDEAA